MFTRYARLVLLLCLNFICSMAYAAIDVAVKLEHGTAEPGALTFIEIQVRITEAPRKPGLRWNCLSRAGWQ